MLAISSAVSIFDHRYVQETPYVAPAYSLWRNRIFFSLGACCCTVASVALIMAKNICPIIYPVGLILGVIKGAILAEKDPSGLFVFEEAFIEQSISSTLKGSIGLIAVMQRALPAPATISLGLLGDATGMYIGSWIRGADIVENTERLRNEELAPTHTIHTRISQISLLAGAALTIAFRISPLFLVFNIISMWAEHLCIVQNRWSFLFCVKCAQLVTTTWMASASRVALVVSALGMLTVTGRL